MGGWVLRSSLTCSACTAWHLLGGGGGGGGAPAPHAIHYRALPLPLAADAGAECCGGSASGSEWPAACRLARHVTTKSQIEPVSQPKRTCSPAWMELPHRSGPSPVGSARSSCTQLGASTLERVGVGARVRVGVGGWGWGWGRGWGSG